MKCFVALLALASVAAARHHYNHLRPYARVVRDSEPEPQYEHPEPQYHRPEPSYAPAPSYSRPSYKEPEYAPVDYSYGYVVRDDYAGLQYDANEERKGYSTTGGYSVLLPDGRTQHVRYRVDDATSGWIADVSYEGEARYDDEEPSGYHPRPSYKPRPTYEEHEYYQA